ncbi:sensor histidine kinase [Allorhizobium borbori]|uniref:histidine kinase n=1 Tax=Allorhizobium borbori TaxID=485907 RepID=A0A7W6K229_9HYPH|nr:sensor histidine kinase [Allorhizobium borbori]MBB4103723.1 two-component system sensor histidine kinase TctE [Allorhizobium borbori]
MSGKGSLFSRLMWRMSIVLAISAAGLITAAWFYARAAADEAYDRLLLGSAFQMTESLTVRDGELQFELPASAFELLGLAESDRIFYRVIAPGGKTLTGYTDLDTGADIDASRKQPRFADGSYKGEDIRTVTIARALSLPQGVGWANVIVAQTVESRRALASELTVRATVLVAVMSLLALGGAALAVRYSLAPVARLGEALSRREPQDLTPLDVSVPAELSPFVSSINHFITRLSERMQLMQRYIADSAHQIRTPLTALNAQVSLIDEDQLPPEGRRHLERVRRRAAELARFTNQLLNHAMVIHRFDSVHLTPVALNDVARKAFRAAIPITVDPDLVVSFEASEEALYVTGDELSLREAIVNIIDNALRHGASARLDVKVWRDGDFGVVEVSDDGAGIPEAEWSNVLKRFHSSQSDGAASGLGFAIAAEVAGALKGGLRFRTKSETAPFAIQIALPLSSAPIEKGDAS